jgi:WD40 repeat protein
MSEGKKFEIISLTANDADGDTLTWSFASDAGHGKAKITNLEITGENTIEYTPNPYFSGADSFIIQVNDNNGAIATITVNINVTSVNDVPQANGADSTTFEDTILHGVLSSSDSDGDTLTYEIKDNGSKGVADVSTNGLFTYTPDSNKHGEDSFTFTASDGVNESAPATVNVTINPMADTPSVTNASTDNGEQTKTGLVISRHIDDGSEVTHFKITNISNGKLYKADGVTEITANQFIEVAEGDAGLKFTPFGTTSNGSFKIQAATANDDKNLGGDIITATVNTDSTNDPPVISEIDDVFMPYGNDVTFKVIASDPDVPAQTLLFVLSGNVPAGAMINPITGQFTWFPTSAGEFAFTVVVIDDGQNPSNLSASEQITITITKGPILEPIGDKIVPVEIPLAFTAIAKHHHSLTFSLKNEPTGATISPEGEFNWTPKQEGIHKATIVVTESAGLTAEETITITVSKNTLPILKPIGNQIILLNRVFNFTAKATDVQNNNFIYGLNEAPEGATINPSSGQFTWIPTKTGTYKVTVQVIETDGDPTNLSTSETLDIFVNTNPTLASISDKAVEVNETLTFTVNASHPENNPLLFSLGDTPASDPSSFSQSDAPAVANIDPNTGEFTWTPTNRGAFKTTIQVTEQISQLTDQITIMINVGLNNPPILTPIGNHTIPVNRVFKFTANAVDNEGNTFVYGLNDAPEGATIHPLTGIFTWIPTKPDIYNVTVNVIEVDGQPTNLTSRETITLTVNTNPALDPIEEQKIIMGNQLNFTATAFHPLANPLIFSLVGAPNGARIDPQSGVFAWIPDRVGVFDIIVKVTETEGNLSDEKAVKILVTLAQTELYLSLSSATILKNGPLEVFGKLHRSQYAEESLKDLDIQLTVIDPNFDSFARTTKTYTDYGDYRFEDLPPFDIEGEYIFQTTFNRNASLHKAESTQQTLTVNQVAGYAILVQGRTADGEGMETYNKTLNRVYLRMKVREFKDEDIHYFNYNTAQEKIGIHVDGIPTKTAIQAAFLDLQKRIKNAPAPLFIVMVDHGGIDGSFYIDDGNGAKITPHELSNWLGNFEQGLTETALEKPRVVIIGSCYSGSFIPRLSKQGRVVVTSAAHDEESYKGPKEPDETRSGEFFMEGLFSQLGKGKSLKTSFELAAEATKIFTRLDDSIPLNNRFQDKAAQHPLLDDNNDKEGSNELSTGDGKKAAHIFLGAGTNLKLTNINTPAEILKVTNTTFLAVTELTSDLFATVNNPVRVEDQKIMVDIRTPSMALDTTGAEATGQLEIDELERIFLTIGEENRFTGLFDQFYEPGKYEVFYFVNDAISGDMSTIKRSVVYKDKVGNRSPKAFNLITPATASQPETTLIFDWESTTDPDSEPVTYTLLVSTDPDFNKVVYQQEELSLSMSYIDRTTPIDDALNNGKPGLRDGTEYFWKVEAIDNYGSKSFSEVFSFTTNNTNAPPGRCSIHVSSALDFSAIGNAEISLVDDLGNPLPDPDIYPERGNYYMLLQRGRRRAVVRAAGFKDKEVELDTTSGFAAINIQLEPVAEILVKPGQLQFTFDKASVAENQETISLLVKRVNGRDGEISVNYASDDGSAIDGHDYFGSQGTLTWADQENQSKRITIGIKNDTNPEPDKTFKVVLFEPTGSATLVNIQKISVTITDDDWKDESAATETLSSGNPSGNSSGDSVSEDSASGDSGTAPGNGGSDNNYISPNKLQFVAANYFVQEAGGVKNFRVIRLGSTVKPVSVQYAIIGGTATEGQDYTGGTGTLTWEAGNNFPKSIDLKILEDDEPEDNETIELYLFEPIGEIAIGEPSQTTLIISDNDKPVLSPTQTVQFSSNSYTAHEVDKEPITLTVTRTGNGEGEVSVQYVAMPYGTAVANIDYSGDVFGTLTWVDGDSEPKLITLNLYDDKEIEPPETVHIMLFNTTGEIALSTPSEMILTIMDNDRLSPTIPLSLGQSMGLANDGTLYDATSLKNLFDTSVLFWGAAKVKDQNYTTTLFSQPSQMVEIAGEINVDPKHVGKTADILVVASVYDEVAEVAPLFLMVDYRGQVQEWSGDVTTLVGSEENIVLPQTQLIEIYQGFFDPVRLQIYFGYRLHENGFIYFNGEQPIKVWVEEEHEYSLAEQNSILFADLSHDGQSLVTASKDGLVRLWDMNTGSRLALLRGHTDTVRTAMFSPKGHKILTASIDGTARLWDVATTQELFTFQGHTNKVEQAAFSPDGQRIITASDDNTARIWNVADGKTLFILEGHEQGVQYTTFSNDGKRVVTVSWDHTARLWNAETSEEIAVLAGHENMIEHAAFSPDDQYIVTTSWDKTARLWDAETGLERLVLKGHRNGVAYAAFSPDGEYIITTSWDTSVRLWDTKNGESLWERKHLACVHHAAFSPDGQLIVTGGNDGTARLWETATGKPIKTLKGHEGNVWHVGFSPDGKRVISASWDNTVRVWEVESGEVVMVLKD